MNLFFNHLEILHDMETYLLQLEFRFDINWDFQLILRHQLNTAALFLSAKTGLRTNPSTRIVLN